MAGATRQRLVQEALNVSAWAMYAQAAMQRFPDSDHSQLNSDHLMVSSSDSLAIAPSPSHNALGLENKPGVSAIHVAPAINSAAVFPVQS